MSIKYSTEESLIFKYHAMKGVGVHFCEQLQVVVDVFSGHGGLDEPELILNERPNRLLEATAPRSQRIDHLIKDISTCTHRVS